MSSKRSRLLVPNILVDGFERDIQESCIYARARLMLKTKRRQKMSQKKLIDVLWDDKPENVTEPESPFYTA